MAYVESSTAELAAWKTKKCEGDRCDNDGAYMYCWQCERELCTACRNLHYTDCNGRIDPCAEDDIIG